MRSGYVTPRAVLLQQTQETEPPLSVGASTMTPSAINACASGSALKITGDATIDGNLSATLTLQDTVPTTDDTYDLGSSTKEWKDLYVDGTANIDTLAVTDAFTYGSTTWTETSGVNELTGSSWSFKATSGSGDLFSITNTDDDIVFRVQDSVVIMAARDTTPTPVSGGLFYSGSDQWFLGYKTFGSAS